MSICIGKDGFIGTQMNTDKEMPKITCGILCLYIFVIGVICEICG